MVFKKATVAIYCIVLCHSPAFFCLLVNETRRRQLGERRARLGESADGWARRPLLRRIAFEVDCDNGKRRESRALIARQITRRRPPRTPPKVPPAPARHGIAAARYSVPSCYLSRINRRRAPTSLPKVRNGVVKLLKQSLPVPNPHWIHLTSEFKPHNQEIRLWGIVLLQWDDVT
ncbi:hypothetical protein EVAR_17273_1 [Eumeta japonica]|uniref:Uncharacterized protein n=1 Tax=Eumeta variegata TaxID=151549 RepID=A0A4C1TTC0_EUMVA|nr:hypothetical protein EVAR_17273_1 [Eumeta japonica]